MFALMYTICYFFLSKSKERTFRDCMQLVNLIKMTHVGRYAGRLRSYRLRSDSLSTERIGTGGLSTDRVRIIGL